uniref:Predicted nucleic acid-binding protein, contains PIN domain n=1 Tax=Candidatus Kentrum sp. SD TaxID=2126332 RepID=A0A450YMJ2_9GAMM|nr:MAG: Predicted nucleic acid-binding protein, contains PIN domain [Candidatus Kentron sp. SD]VFK48128.1 MAG: Predicted nucleic acid-binding protein, contains PIN domain [Candidatus Kentron sp. SD]
MKEKVYIETSIIGAYFDDREDIASRAQKFWTRRWWDELGSRYEIVSSDAVVNELEHPNYPHSAKALEFIAPVQKLSIENEIRQIVSIYIQNQLMPQDPIGDALHLAIASYHKCDYLLTWNCKHIANPNKFRRIRMCNTSLGFFVPTLCTPNLLIGD